MTACDAHNLMSDHQRDTEAIQLANQIQQTYENLWHLDQLGHGEIIMLRAIHSHAMREIAEGGHASHELLHELADVVLVVSEIETAIAKLPA